MSAYVIVDIQILDAEKFETYKQLAPLLVAAYDGRYLTRGGRAEKLEGGREPRRVVILEFPSYERAKEWWSCAEYADAKALRQASADSEMWLVEGV